MIFAAGLGTRLKPYTDNCPKAMVEVGGLPMIAHQLLRLREAGFRRVVINVHHYASQIIDYVTANDGFGLDVAFSDERGQLLDTGGGIRKALPLFDADSPVLIHNVDIFSNADLAALYRSHQESKADATLLVSQRNTSRYLVFDDAWRLVAWKNIHTGEVRTAYEELEQALAPLGADIAQHRLRSAEEVFSITNDYWQHAADYHIRGAEAPADFCWVDAGKPEALSQAAEIAKLITHNS